MKGEIKNVVLMLTDKNCNVVNTCFHQINMALDKNTKSYILYHLRSDNYINTQSKNEYYGFTDNDLAGLGFISMRDQFLPVDCHFPVLKFYHENPDYEYYWVIEDDVRFNGDWSVFLNSFKDINSDFLSTTIRNWEDETNWCWWSSLSHSEKSIPLNKRIASFNPIYRISNKAVQFIYDSLLDGWKGHHEVLLPTLLQNNGFSINDIGGNGKFVLPGFMNLFYLPDSPLKQRKYDEVTMRYRPAFKKIGSTPGKLYHPVKDFNMPS